MVRFDDACFADRDIRKSQARDVFERANNSAASRANLLCVAK
jgi:hypothetical protein